MMPPLVPIALAVAVGIALASCLPLSPVTMLLTSLGSGMLCLVCRRASRLSFVTLLLLWVCLGILRTIAYTRPPPASIASSIRAEPQPVLIHGIVVDDPVDSFSPNEPEQQICVLEAQHRRLAGMWRPATGWMRVRLRGRHPPLAYGDEVVVEGNASTVPGPGNPGQYDWRAALARQRIHALLAVEPFHGVVRLGAGQGHWWFRAVYAFRQRLEQLIATQFDPVHAGLLRSLLLGQRVALEDELKRAFVQTGTMHLLVISGFNVGLMAVLLELFLRVVGVPFRVRLVATAVWLLGYCALTGMQPPVARATVMAWVLLGALWLDRVIDWPNTLAAAALAILLITPTQLFDAGFQLSFGAVASLLVFTARLRTWMESLIRLRPLWLQRYLAVSVASTIAIWLGLWPLLAWYFHLVSPVSVLANLLLVPLVSVAVASGTVVLLVGTAAEWVVQWTGSGLAALVDLIVVCVRWCQQMPLGSWSVGHPSWFVIGGYYLFVTVTLLRPRLRWSMSRVVMSWLVGVNLWIWSDLGARLIASRWLEVTVLDVGHGDSLVIRTPTQQTLLIDAGTQDAGRYAVVPFLRFKGWHTVDALILTHPDEDHLGGAVPLLQEIRVKRMFTNGFPATTRTARQVFELAHANRIPHDTLSAGMQLTGASGVEMRVLHPPQGFVPGTAPSSNDNSLVLKIVKRESGMLLCGDLETQGVPWVMRWGTELRATILKVAHHGSALGPEGRAFVKRVHPATAIISVGRLHHLPSPDTVQELTAAGAQILLTRDRGAVTVRTDGRRVFLTTVRDDPAVPRDESQHHGNL